MRRALPSAGVELDHAADLGSAGSRVLRGIVRRRRSGGRRRAAVGGVYAPDEAGGAELFDRRQRRVPCLSVGAGPRHPGRLGRLCRRGRGGRHGGRPGGLVRRYRAVPAPAGRTSIPHTAITQAQEATSSGEAWGTFVRENFLSAAVVETKLRDAQACPVGSASGCRSPSHAAERALANETATVLSGAGGAPARRRTSSR